MSDLITVYEITDLKTGQKTYQTPSGEILTPRNTVEYKERVIKKALPVTDTEDYYNGEVKQETINALIASVLDKK